MSGIYLPNVISVSIFGMILSAAFCDISWTAQKYWFLTAGMALLLLLQGFIYFWFGLSAVHGLYPAITHLPLAAMLCRLSKKSLWPVISVLTAYLCCQLRRWLALLIVTTVSGDFMMQNTAELIVTFPLLPLLLRFIAPSVRSMSCYTTSEKCQFGLIPTLYYGFDYLTRIYTNLLSKGFPIAVEFMPFVCSVAYLIFVLRASTEARIRNRLEQTQNILNLQIAQAIREIALLRETQQKISAYRHDLRHHMQYLLSCIENGRPEQAQSYIQEIFSEIEANTVTVFCENEAANLIFSAFAGQAKGHDIPLKIKAAISQSLPVSESDLCVLLSNALENALHACRKLKEAGSSGTIEVSAHEKNGKLFLQIINSCDANVTFSHGIPVADRDGHGIGVRSICAIVEQYGGICIFSVKNGHFTLLVSL